MHFQIFRKFLLCLSPLYFLIPRPVYAQNETSVPQLKNILSAITKKQATEFREAAYIQFDKPYYNTGDTLWYKAYIFDAAGLTSTKMSGLLYIRLSNEKDEQLKLFILPLIAGVGWGNIPLPEDELPPGNYSVKAYTNWMRNYGEEGVFTQNFYITGYTSNTWLLTASNTVNNSKDSSALRLSLHTIDKSPVRLQDLRLKVIHNNKTLANGKLQTGVDGSLAVNIPLPLKTAGKQILLTVAEDSKKQNKQQLTLPLTINRPSNADVQFLPEGGNLVAGLGTRIGLKAIAEDGSSIPVSGEIRDKDHKQVTTFKTIYNGMGSFNFTPQANQSYTALVNINGVIKTYPLPLIKDKGTILNITNPNDTSSFIATIKSTTSQKQFYLIGISRGIACYGSVIHLNGNQKQVRINKEIFPTGIVRISLLNQDHQPLNERLVYVDHHDQLKISIKNNKPAYGKRDSVSLQLTVTDEANKPVIGSFSLSVTDNEQVKKDSSTQTNILTTLLLSSGVKGEIETPNHYLQPTNDAWNDLDLLLLTQGWTNYEWNEIFKPGKEPQFKAQSQFEINGKVTNAFGKSLANTKVSLLGNKPLIVKDTLTNSNGQFTFRNFPPVDTPVFKLKAVNRGGKEFNVNIDVDKDDLPVFTKINRLTMPWNANIDSILLKNASYKILTQNDVKAVHTNGGQMLNEVKIKGLKIVKGSKNLNGLGNADQVIDEQDLLASGKMTLFEVLQKKIKGFSFDGQAFFIDRQKLNFIFDGIDLQENDPMSFIEIKNLLSYYTAEDLKGLEVMRNMSYSAQYNARYKPGVLIRYLNGGPAYIEITTRSNSGPFLSVIPGMYLYKSPPFAWPRKSFYSPRYPGKRDTVKTVDRRSTLFWAPDILTNAEGKATLSFYTSDLPGTYTITVEGSDMQGEIGSVNKEIIVE